MIKKAILLCGGAGTRLLPCTKVTNKHLLPVGNKPMIYHSIEKLVDANIKNILIVTGTEHMGNMITLLGSGNSFNCNFTYKVQDEAGGIAQALSLGEDFAGDDTCCVVLGDNIFQDHLKPLIDDFSNGARIFLKEVSDPQRFGVAQITNSKVVCIEEKPTQPKSNLAVTGIYCYDNEVFKIIRSLSPSKRGEYEITDVNNVYLSRGSLSYSILNGWWSDAGTFSSLHYVNNLLLTDQKA